MKGALDGNRKLVGLLATLAYFLALGVWGKSDAMVDSLSWVGSTVFVFFLGGNAHEHWVKNRKPPSPPEATP